MQNQIALYLIFISGAVLIIAAMSDWDYILGPKKTVPENKENQAKFPLLTSFMHTFLQLIQFWNWLIPKSRIRDNKMTYLDHDRKNKRVFYAILGLVFILLGIIALNSGKFS